MELKDFYWGEMEEGELVKTRAKHRKQGYDFAIQKMNEIIDGTVFEKHLGYSNEISIHINQFRDELKKEMGL